MRAEIAHFRRWPLCLRGCDRERRHRGCSLLRPGRRVRAGRRGGGRLLAQLQAGQGTDQRDLGCHDGRHLQCAPASDRPLDSQEFGMLPADPRRLAAGPGDQRRLPGARGRRQYRDPPAARQHRDRRALRLRAGAGDGLGKLHRDQFRVRRQPSRPRRVLCLLRPDVGRLGRPLRPRRQRLRDRDQRQLPVQPDRGVRDPLPAAGRGLRVGAGFQAGRASIAAGSAIGGPCSRLRSRSTAASAATGTWSSPGRCSAAVPAATARP